MKIDEEEKNLFFYNNNRYITNLPEKLHSAYVPKNEEYFGL